MSKKKWLLLALFGIILAVCLIVGLQHGDKLLVLENAKAFCFT
jgi:hypothetical protein